ncbi:MAG: acyl-CoA carboxylase subunit epsilon [Actinobacteria bacterium]|nr:acyl-CoA carboxylase subunit epsilon [Actinomycetota bacterium]
MPAPPFLRLISGNATDEELAAIVAVFSTRSRGRAVPPPTLSLWARRSRQVRPSQRPGYGSWRASTMPR